MGSSAYGSVATGYDPKYLTDEVGKGRESYYLDAVTEGEPPGQWLGAGAEAFGLTGEIDDRDMHALYSLHLDPRDERFRQEDQWSKCPTLGAAPGRYRSTEDRFAGALLDEGLSEDRVAEIRTAAAGLTRQPTDRPGQFASLTERMAAVALADLPAERVRELRTAAESGTRTPVKFLDATFSVSKSVTVLRTAYGRLEAQARAAGDIDGAATWAARGAAIDRAVDVANRAWISELQQRAGYARVGHHGGGAGRWIDAPNWTVASFRQNTSRENDPQIHVHNAILNRVVCADGKVRTLDSKAIHRARGAAAAIASRVLEAELGASLGLRFATREDGKAREIIGVSRAAMDLFSQRARHISTKLAELASEFKATRGREPNAYELARLSQRATMATRPAKGHVGETIEARYARWEREMVNEVGETLADVAASVDAAVGKAARSDAAAAMFSPSAVCIQAIDELARKQGTFTVHDLTRAVAEALPDGTLDGLTSQQATETLHWLTDAALEHHDLIAVAGDFGDDDGGVRPPELSRADGSSVYSTPGGSLYSSRNHWRGEQALLDAAIVRGHRALVDADVRGWIEAAREQGLRLGADQEAAVRGVLTSGAAMEVLIGPAGTGKSTTVGTMARAWTDLTGGRVIGMATSERATQELRGNGLDQSLNIAAFLAAQGRIDSGRRQPGDLVLTAADIVVIDEASMVDTDIMNAIRARAHAAGAKLLLAGDPNQLDAIGAGGAMAMLDGVAKTYELADVRRFTEAWEGPASLRLRARDVTVLHEYIARGRVIDGGTIDAALRLAARSYVADRARNRDSIVIVDTNALAAQASAYVRADLVALGLVEESGVALGHSNEIAGVGDLILCRETQRHAGRVNRERLTVTETRPDGSIVGRRDDDTMVTLPPDYVAAHVTLAYGATKHAVQGANLGAEKTVASSATSAAGLYVPLTRGQESNVVFVVTATEAADAATGDRVGRDRRTTFDVLAGILTREESPASALGERDAYEAAMTSAATLVNRYASEVADTGTMRLRDIFDTLHAAGTLSDDERIALAADQATGPLARLVRSCELAGHDPVALLTEAVEARDFAGARSVAQVLHGRITTMLDGTPPPTVESLADAAPTGLSPQWTERLAWRAEAIDARRRELGTAVISAPPQWAIEALGPVPDDVVGRADWEHRASVVELAREALEHDDPSMALGPAPAQDRTEHRAVWHAAWSALGNPQSSAEEKTLSIGNLRARAAAAVREETWAPPYVGDALRNTVAEATRYREASDVLAVRAANGDSAAAAEADRLRGLAELREAQAAELAPAHEIRNAWFAETVETRAHAKRAVIELANRGHDVGAEDDRTTAEEWHAAEARARAEDDAHRTVTETDLSDDADAADMIAVDDASADAQAVDRASSDTDTVDVGRALPDRVPTAAETAATVAVAVAAAAELADRREAEERHAAELHEEDIEQARRQQEHAIDVEARQRATETAREAADVAM